MAKKPLEDIISTLEKINPLKWEKGYKQNRIYPTYFLRIKNLEFELSKLHPKEYAAEYELAIWGSSYHGAHFFQGKLIGKLYKKLDKALGDSPDRKSLLKDVLEYIQE